MNIVLLGYMGSGKSTIGKQLAENTDMNFNDLDDLIVENEGMPINAIFEKKGELYFRKKEHQILFSFLEKQTSSILSLGGGTPCYFDTMEDLLSHGYTTVYLKAGIATLAQRLWTEKAHRPMISHIENEMELNEFIGKHLFERNPFYQKAKMTVNVDAKSINEIVAEIVKKLA